MDNYSSLFTMGLLSERASPVSSPKSSFFCKFRKSSLPTKALSKPSEMYSRGEGRFYPNNAPPPQFTNPFGDSPTATNELRSFLSLDLAADGTSTARRSSNYLSPLDPNAGRPYEANISPLQQLSADNMAPQSPPPPPRRPSRDSLLTPPGPAPSAALPDVPSDRQHARPPPPILIPSGTMKLCQPPHSAPPVTFAPSSFSVPSYVSPPSPSVSPRSPVSPPTSRRGQHGSFFSFSSNTTSVRTSFRRNAERSNALACLEGHSRVPGRISRSTRQQNFMSMSDDEDEAGDDADGEDDGDVFSAQPPVPAPPPPRSVRTRASSFILPASLPSAYVATVVTGSRSPIDEEEDRVLPPAAISALTQSSPSKPKARSRRSTLESWFPLANFIDLKDDDLSGWRGVVEILSGL